MAQSDKRDPTDRPRRPNVLFIIADQLRFDHLGFAGNEVVSTPNLDRLADRGVVFDNAWVANPICMPNRSTLMTGRLPSAHGVIMNDRSLDWGANTHVRSFRSAGYRTGLFGKSHLQHGMSRNSVTEAARGPVEVSAWPDGWDTLEDFERYGPDPSTWPDWPGDFYGFDRVELAIDHGARVTGHHLAWALDRGGRYEDLMVPLSAEAPAQRRSEHWWQIYQPPYVPEFHSTNFVVDRTIDFIDEAAATETPWLAWASFPDPHHPFTPPGHWFDRHRPDDMELPSTFDDPMAHAPEFLRRVQSWTPDRQRSWVSPCGAGSPELVREAMAATYGMIEFIDDGVGRILDSVEAHGQTDDTIVVFTSDHGDMMGDHGLMLKGNMHYRGTLQIPLVIADPTRPAGRRSPGRSPGRSHCLVGSVDVAQTLLDLADLAPYEGMQGASIVPCLDDPDAAADLVHDTILIEDDLPAEMASRAGGRVPAKTRTLVCADGVKYTRHSTGEGQLFDLGADPDEMAEVGHRDPGRRADAIERLTDALITASDVARGAPVAL